MTAITLVCFDADWKEYYVIIALYSVILNSFVTCHRQDMKCWDKKHIDMKYFSTSFPRGWTEEVYHLANYIPTLRLANIVIANINWLTGRQVNAIINFPDWNSSRRKFSISQVDKKHCFLHNESCSLTWQDRLLYSPKWLMKHLCKNEGKFFSHTQRRIRGATSG